MSDELTCDILVVGGGLIGTALALGLEHQGWDVILVESATADELTRVPPPAQVPDDFEPRVSALSLASQSLLGDLGAWPLDGGRVCDYQRMVVWDGEGTGRIEFDAADLQVSALGAIVENRLVISALMQRVQASKLRLLDGATVTGWWEQPDGGRGIELSDGRRIQAALTVAADGARSKLRQWAGVPSREWDYQQQAIVCTVQTAQSHRHTAWQRFATTGPLAFLPLAGEDPQAGHFCSIVWSQDTAEARRLMALPDDDFRQALGEAIEQQLGPVEAVSRRHAFPLRQCHAKQYSRPGLVLVGDAAHAIHPLAGQGANLGYSDVRVLLEELARARDSGLAPDDHLTLARYERRRKGENLAMMAAMEGFKTLFAQEALPLRWLRNTGMRWLDGAAPLKNRLAAQAMGLGV
ncbi:MAG: UbiH/UbiF/VisC/COQ6 family ubiquinone biosynthesis hydroxylase [Marinobacter sp.]|uniref:UbiH/UbiF/VisC/COQ6 family ubiquinone biosynthesis hydroxylase n=1 Tax=Marinobacter sp. TaxID=50741 RepID=UPI00299E15CC|nr:UbiH/UbiF/VisC/COQ6 family ubiquinone biosynthesis hydroxylase [Marinobacter sp.]MDX1633320.1 UbiH/UbiF/VisC/COQ6 family ubiquinone biosynthesis hydroxylase [Marinobacter sp.]